MCSHTLALPNEGLNVPGAQRVQLSTSPRLKDPGAQLISFTEPGGQRMPAEHGKQDDWPDSG